MTSDTPVETNSVETNSVETSSENSSLENLRQEIVTNYLHYLDEQKGGIVGTVAGFSSSLGINFSLNPLHHSAKKYLLGEENTFEKVGKFRKFLEKIGVVTSSDDPLEMLSSSYDKISLDKMKNLLEQHKNDKIALDSLKASIEKGEDPTIVSPVVVASQTASSTIDNQEFVSEQQKRNTVMDQLTTFIKDEIPYVFGSRDPKKGLDCSGLIIASMKNANLSAPGLDSRQMFQNLSPQKLEKNDSGGITPLSGIVSGDLIFWDSKNPDYKWSSGQIPSIKKENQIYRIHHVAFVKDIDYTTGKIIIIESNGSHGVVESEITIDDELKKKHQSDLYVAHLDYTKLDEYSSEKENQTQYYS